MSKRRKREPQTGKKENSQVILKGKTLDRYKQKPQTPLAHDPLSQCAKLIDSVPYTGI
jgi:hypothetical protein